MSHRLIDVDPNDIETPFPVRRVYYLYGTKADRGGHAHRRLHQLACCPVGACTFILDDGERRTEVRLDRRDKGLLIGPGTWRKMTAFTPDCVLVVFASEPFDEADYAWDYDAFKHSARPLQSG